MDSAIRTALCTSLLLAAAGCGKTMGEEDCRKVADSMREVWMAEAQQAAAPDAPGAAKAAGVVKTEGDRLIADWLTECKTELQGRRVDAREVDCLLSAKTIAAVNACAEH